MHTARYTCPMDSWTCPTVRVGLLTNARVDRHALNSPALSRFCVVADAVAVSAVVLILLGTLALGAAKTLFGTF